MAKYILIILGAVGLIGLLTHMNSGYSTHTQPLKPIGEVIPQFDPAYDEKDKWEVSEGQSGMDDSSTVYLSLKAKWPVKVWLKEVWPTLYITCREHKTYISVRTETSANPELGEYNRYTVRIRLDDKKPIQQKWNGSTDNDSLFAPNAVGLAKELVKSHYFKFEFIPYNASRVMVEFSTTGLDKHLPLISSNCGWKY